jgi:hypothetical protein
MRLYDVVMYDKIIVWTIYFNMLLLLFENKLFFLHLFFLWVQLNPQKNTYFFVCLFLFSYVDIHI